MLSPKPLCRSGDVGGNGKEVMVQGPQGPEYLMLFRQDDEILAFHNSCPHMGRNLNWAPDRFLLSPEGLLVCAHHGASFDLASGECLEGPCRGAHLKPVGITIKDDEIWLD